MSLKFVSSAVTLGFLGLAASAHAQSPVSRVPNLISNGTTFAQFIGSGSSGIVGAINTIVIPLIVALTFAAFIWGVVQSFFLHGDNEESRAKGRQLIFWGVIGLALEFCVWGLLYILLSTLNIYPSA